MNPTKILNLGQAAELADCSRDTIRRAAQRDELRAEMRPGKRGPQWWVREADLLDWLQVRQHETVQHHPTDPPIGSVEDQIRYYEERAEKAEREASLLKMELAEAREIAYLAEERLRVARDLMACSPESLSLWKKLRKMGEKGARLYFGA